MSIINLSGLTSTLLEIQGIEEHTKQNHKEMISQIQNTWHSKEQMTQFLQQIKGIKNRGGAAIDYKLIRNINRQRASLGEVKRRKNRDIKSSNRCLLDLLPLPPNLGA